MKKFKKLIKKAIKKIKAEEALLVAALVFVNLAMVFFAAYIINKIN